MNEQGNKKLSKRDGAKDILAYREEGYLPDALPISAKCFTNLG